VSPVKYELGFYSQKKVFLDVHSSLGITNVLPTFRTPAESRNVRFSQTSHKDTLDD
jgi:hypothetical protein